jgi:hypothetical protein
MIRDFWAISKSRLKDEIDALEDKLDPLTWKAIDSVRKIGNIGAHMEKDINVIVDVEPNEAQKLIELIETLVEDWYVVRHQREERLRQIAAIADAKTPPQPADEKAPRADAESPKTAGDYSVEEKKETGLSDD